jgi:integrase
VKNQIAPRLGKLLLSQVTPAVIQTWLGELRESGGCDGEGLAANSVIHAWTTLSAALSAAVDLGLIPTNPARRTRLPRVEQPEIVILTAAEVIHLLQAVRGDVIEPAVLLAAYAGLRRGECLGLRWADVNLKDGWAMVRRSRYVIPGEIGTKGPKTGKSRGIPLAEPARERLAEIVQEQAAGRLALSLPAEGEGWVCCHADGRPLRPDTLSHRFTLLRERAGLPAVTFHGLRHSCATLLLSLGVPSRVIADLLGHSSTTMTDQVYAHVTQEVLSDAVRRLGENLGSGGQP